MAPTGCIGLPVDALSHGPQQQLVSAQCLLLLQLTPGVQPREPACLWLCGNGAQLVVNDMLLLAEEEELDLHELATVTS